MNVTIPTPVRRAETEISTLLAACADYQQMLTRLAIPDPIGARVDELYTKYKVNVQPRSLYGEIPRRGY